LCEQRLGDIRVPAPFDLDDFARSVARHRGRPIRILPMPGLSGTDALSGTWVIVPEVDLILIAAEASSWHRALIGLHEVSHMLCGHRPAIKSPAGFSALVPGQAGETGRLLAGHGYSRPEEREAEMLAGLVLERADSDLAHPLAQGPDGITGRLARVLRHPVRHV
jgi:hypothetical protein